MAETSWAWLEGWNGLAPLVFNMIFGYFWMIFDDVWGFFMMFHDFWIFDDGLMMVWWFFMMCHVFWSFFDDVWCFFMMFHDFGMIFDDFSWCLIQCLMILDYVWWFSYHFLGWTSIRTSYFASARYQDFAGVGYLKGFIRLNNFVVKVAKNKLCPIHHPFITWEVFYTLSSFHWWTRISTETNPYHQPRSHIFVFFYWQQKRMETKTHTTFLP